MTALRIAVWGGVAVLLAGGVALYATRGPVLLVELATQSARAFCF